MEVRQGNRRDAGVAAWRNSTANQFQLSNTCPGACSGASTCSSAVTPVQRTWGLSLAMVCTGVHERLTVVWGSCCLAYLQLAPTLALMTALLPQHCHHQMGPYIFKTALMRRWVVCTALA